MRLWSLHPKYLDRQGLTAVWREALLAQAVLSGKTKGYTSHPQLDRFKTQPDPIGAIGSFLICIADEALRRGYNFDRTRILSKSSIKLTVTDGQIEFEWLHLLKKLSHRSPLLVEQFNTINKPEPNPLFDVISGAIEPWEKTQIRV